jgi:GGDEF domain-containing protein
MELITRTERALKLARTERELQRSVTLLKRAGSDPDTGLLDRAGLESRLEPELSRSRRYGRPLAVAVLVPVAPPLPDQLRACASLIRVRLRAPDLVGHLGGGNFALVMPECTADNATMAVQRLVIEAQRDHGVHFRCQTVDASKGEEPGDTFLEQLLLSTRGPR